MGLPLSGSDRNQVLLAISNPHFELTIKGPPYHHVVNSFQLHRGENGQPVQAKLTVYPEDNIVQVFDPLVSNRLIENYSGLIHPCFFERTNYEFVIEKKSDSVKDIVVEHQNRKIREAITPTGLRQQVLSGIVNFGDEVGFSRFTVFGDEQELLSFEIEVFPAKLDYRSDFKQLLQEVNEEIYNLAFSFLMKTSFPAALYQDSKTKPSGAEFYYILNAIFERLHKALRLIERNPHQKIVSENRITSPEKVKKTDARTVRWISSKPHLLQKTKDGSGINIAGQSGYLPQRLIEKRKIVTLDTYENQFLKWMLQNIQSLLKRFSDSYRKREGMAFDERVLTRVQFMSNFIDNYCRYSFLQEVSMLQRVDNYSLVIQLAPGYKDTYRYYLMLQKGLQIKSNIFDLSIRDLAVLYEYWCYLKINRLLRDKYSLEQNIMITVDREGITVNLQKGKESEVLFFDHRNNEQISVLYNRFFTSLPTLAQKPDNLLKLEKKGSNTTYHYILDAKYRISTDKEYVQAYGQPGPPEDTINAMHRYRDAIVAVNSEDNGDKGSKYSKSVFGAFVLFPHNDELRFAGRKEESPSRFFKSIDEVGIGALPFLPGQTRLVEEFLDNLILESPRTAFERTVIHDGTEDYYNRDQYRPNVLIGPLGRKEQLQICLDHSMYYTYFDQVKNYLGHLEYVAIYQSKEKFKNEAEQGIFYYGKIMDFHFVQRSKIKEMPAEKGRENKQAVKFIIEQWKKKTTHIAAIGYGPARPLTTTWVLFKEAKYYPELHLKLEEARLWRELNRVEECSMVSFPNVIINDEDSFQSMIFPGLIIRGYKSSDDENMFMIETEKAKQSFTYRRLRRSPGKTIREIIRFWKENSISI